MAGDWTGTKLVADIMDTATNSSVYLGTSQYSTLFTWSAETPHVEVDGGVKKSSRGIHPRLYFKYLKSKLILSLFLLLFLI